VPYWAATIRAVYFVSDRALTLAPRSIRSFILSASGAAIISAVVPPDLVATLGSSPASSSFFTSAVDPNSIVSAHGSTAGGATPGSGSGTTGLPGPSAYASAITDHAPAWADRN